MLHMESEADANNEDLSRTSKELVGGRKFFGSPMKDASDRLLIYRADHLKKWKEYITLALNHIRSGEFHLF